MINHKLRLKISSKLILFKYIIFIGDLQLF